MTLTLTLSLLAAAGLLLLLRELNNQPAPKPIRITRDTDQSS